MVGRRFLLILRDTPKPFLMSDDTENPVSPWASWSLDKEVVVTRVVDAARDEVFRAWVDPLQILQWFGPDGFKIESHEIDIRAGGMWLFDMVAPDGTNYPNLMSFLRIEAPALIEVRHGTGANVDPDVFGMLVTFDQQDNGKTVVTLRQMHPTAARRAAVMQFGAVEFGGQTLGKLAEHVTKQGSAT